MILPDEVLGESELPALVNHSPTPLAVTLNSPEKPKDPDSPLPPTGVVFLTILSEDNLMAVWWEITYFFVILFLFFVMFVVNFYPFIFPNFREK